MIYFDYELSDLRVGAPVDFYARSGELDLPVQAMSDRKQSCFELEMRGIDLDRADRVVVEGLLELEALAECRWHPVGVGRSSRWSSGGECSSSCHSRCFSCSAWG